MQYDDACTLCQIFVPYFKELLSFSTLNNKQFSSQSCNVISLECTALSFRTFSRTLYQCSYPPRMLCKRPCT